TIGNATRARLTISAGRRNEILNLRSCAAIPILLWVRGVVVVNGMSFQGSRGPRAGGHHPSADVELGLLSVDEPLERRVRVLRLRRDVSALDRNGDGVADGISRLAYLHDPRPVVRDTVRVAFLHRCNNLVR